ncbi:g11647 [Coccomyxa viridis]|uniref:G11647 protein n=1 Tax=Coccomyxa viridis TaxID=1274662 RepID=A0ABP1G8J4_9CHLO
MGHAGAIKCLVLLLLCLHQSAGQNPSDIAALVRYDVQRLATDVHVALGLERPATPPMPLLPPPVVPVTTQAPITTSALPTTTVFPMSSTSVPITTDWPATSLPPPSTSTAAAPTSTMQPPVSTTTMAQSTSLAPPSSSIAQPNTTQAPMTTKAAPTTSVATPSTTMAPTTTSGVTTSSAPTTTVQTTAAPGTCTNPTNLTFSGTGGQLVGLQGPFNFSGWTYDAGLSSPPTYPQAILNQASSTQVIGVTASDGVLICHIAASGTNAVTNATFYGHTMVDTISISIVTTGQPFTYTTELWEISYVTLGVT